MVEIKGDLIKLARQGAFDVIAHGCNCFCRMKRGLAPQMAKAFGCDQYEGEEPYMAGDINKLGTISFEGVTPETMWKNPYPLIVVNAYTQYEWSTETKPLDYEALIL